MKEFKAIALYLIQKRVTSSQSMSRWFLPFLEKFKETLDTSMRDGTYHQYIRALYGEKILNSEITSYLLQLSLWREEAKEQLEELEYLGVSILLPSDFGYPKEFAEIADKPTILFCYGNLELLDAEDKITLVGTREPSLWGEMKAKQLSLEASQCGVVTVSGLAQGVDLLVFFEAVKTNGKTIAILPQLDWQSIQGEGANILYISEYPPGKVALSKWQFIARNRLLAALSPYTVVIEAPLRSGTLVTADLALSYGKAVYIVLPDPNEEVSYGGIAFGIQQTVGCFVQSLFDVFYLESKMMLLEKYKLFIKDLSQGKIDIKATDNRHLAHADLSRYLHASAKGDLATLDTDVVELHRFGIIRERKNKIVFNFSGYSSWPKI